VTQKGDDQLMGDGDSEAMDDVTQENTNNGERIYKDYSKPDGKACQDDGTLKDASELVWPNSPSDPNPHDWDLGELEEVLILKRKSPSDEDESGYGNHDELPKVKASCNSL
jgi:hypothetical protein